MNKFRNKNNKLFLAIQILGIWYCVLLTTIYLSSSTGAAFNDVEVIENHLHVFWDKKNPVNGDKSSLEFQNSVGFQCARGFYSLIKNVGDKDMQGPSTFVLYYNENKDPNKNDTGIEISTGTVPALKSGESIELTYLPELKPNSGNYKFMAFQRTGHEGSGELWGDPISVKDNQINACEQWQPDTEEEKPVGKSKENIQATNNEQNPIVKSNSDLESNDSEDSTTEHAVEKKDAFPQNDITDTNNNEENVDVSDVSNNEEKENLEGE
jgi:YqxM protein